MNRNDKSHYVGKKEELLVLYNKEPRLTSEEYGDIIGVSATTVRRWFGEMEINRPRPPVSHKRKYEQYRKPTTDVEEKKRVPTFRTATYYGRAYSPASRGYLRLL